MLRRTGRILVLFMASTMILRKPWEKVSRKFEKTVEAGFNPPTLPHSTIPPFHRSTSPTLHHSIAPTRPSSHALLPVQPQFLQLDPHFGQIPLKQAITLGQKPQAA